MRSNLRRTNVLGFGAVAVLAALLAVPAWAGGSNSAGEPKGKQAAVERMEQRLQEAEAELAAVRDKLAKAGEASRDELQRAKRNAEAAVEDARERLQELRQAGADRWEDIKDRTEDALDRLDDALDAAHDELTE